MGVDAKMTREQQDTPSLVIFVFYKTNINFKVVFYNSIVDNANIDLR